MKPILFVGVEIKTTSKHVNKQLSELHLTLHTTEILLLIGHLAAGSFINSDDRLKFNDICKSLKFIKMNLI